MKLRLIHPIQRLEIALQRKKHKYDTGQGCEANHNVKYSHHSPPDKNERKTGI
jgi:hypothetical protein